MKPLLLAAIEWFTNQATNRLLLAVLVKYEDSGTTQKNKEETPAKMLPSFINIDVSCTICIFVSNDHNKQIWNLKVERKNIEYQYLV